MITFLTLITHSGLLVLPNLGLSVSLIKWRTPICIWHDPPRADFRKRVLAAVQTNHELASALKERSDALAQLNSLVVKKEKNNQEVGLMDDLTRKVIDLEGTISTYVGKEKINDMLIKDCYYRYANQLKLPTICWVTVASNIGVGTASCLVMSSVDGTMGFLLPVLALSATLFTHWLFYPDLFMLYSFKTGRAHAVAMTIAASVAALVFGRVALMAGLLTIPYICVSSYLTYDMISAGQTTGEIKLLTIKFSQEGSIVP